MGFILKRTATTIITLLMVSIAVFSAFRFIPGDPALLSLGTEASDEQLAILRAEMGLDRNFAEQYLSWIRRFLGGELGNSSRFRGEPVSSLILERIPVTFSLAGMAFIFVVLIALPFSLLTVKNENSALGRAAASLSSLGISMPGFFLGVLFIWVFGIFFRLFIPGSYISYRENLFSFFSYLVFPALAAAIPNASLVVKFLRSSIFKELKSDYVRTAKSKGGSRRRILVRHVLKNASLPTITILGMIGGEIFSGSVVIEQVFGIPGIGRLLITSVFSRDFVVVETLVIYIAFIVILANTLADITLQIIDPRIRLAEKA